MTTNRIEAIRQRLNRLQVKGVIRPWQCYNPGDRGRRWLITGNGFIGERAYSTAEVEIYLTGAETALEATGAWTPNGVEVS